MQGPIRPVAIEMYGVKRRESHSVAPVAVHHNATKNFAAIATPARLVSLIYIKKNKPRNTKKSSYLLIYHLFTADGSSICEMNLP